MKEHILLVAEAGDDQLCKDTGISGMSFLLPIESLDWPRSFGLDLMHLVTNVARMMWHIWTDNMKTYPSPQFLGTADNAAPESSFVLSKAKQDAIGRELVASCASVPVSVSRTPRDISKHHGSFKSTEWFEWITIYSIPLLTDRLPDYALSLWVSFVEGVRLLLKVHLTTSEVNQIEQHMIQFIKTTEDIYYHGDPARLSVCTSQLHGLAHLADNIRFLGPAHVSWQFSLERYVGTIERLATSKAHMSKSIYNNLEYLEHVKYARELYPVRYPSKKWKTQRHLEQAIEEDGEIVAHVGRALPRTFDPPFTQRLRRYYSHLLINFEIYSAKMTPNYYDITRLHMNVALGTAEDYILESMQSSRQSGRDRSSVAFYDCQLGSSASDTALSISYGRIVSICYHQPLERVPHHPEHKYRRLLLRVWRYRIIEDPLTGGKYYLEPPTRKDETIVPVTDIIEPIGIIKSTCNGPVPSYTCQNGRPPKKPTIDGAQKLQTQYYIAKGNRIQLSG